MSASDRVVNPSRPTPNSNDMKKSGPFQKFHPGQARVLRWGTWHERQHIRGYLEKNHNLRKRRAVSVREFKTIYPYASSICNYSPSPERVRKTPKPEKGKGSVAIGVRGEMEEDLKEWKVMLDDCDCRDIDAYTMEEWEEWEEQESRISKGFTVSLSDIARPAKVRGKANRPRNAQTPKLLNKLDVEYDLKDEQWEEICDIEEDQWEKVQIPRRLYTEVLKGG
ncbi:hypothetical protein VKT23_010626 [Stygiomarasmius scandens]|uniref:Uncharacterized protein n=1 Tax=Marasmiellus scandens TaxID=2682957 RepID=A0ABR1JGH8_9AGAR